MEIGKARVEDGYIGIDAISGATVTVIAENQVVMRCAYEVAKQVGIIKAVPRAQASFTPAPAVLNWDALVKEGSVQHFVVTPADVGYEDNGQPYLDLYFGYLNAPAVGRNILGEHNYEGLMADLKPNEHAIFIVANGTASFKGSGFVRGGIYDRIQVSQDMDSFTFRDTDYRNLYNIKAAGAPEFHESGIFIVRSSSFSASFPWSLVFLGNKVDKQTGTKTFANFDQEYWLNAGYLQGGRPTIIKLDKPDPTWLNIWKSRIWQIAAFIVLLLFTALTYANRDWLVRHSSRKHKLLIQIPKYIIWIISVVFVGFGMMAQPSITQILTWFHSILFHWQWALFLSEPFIFIFWLFIIITVFIWGRGLFCGWMCPFGSLTELLYKMAGKLGLARFQFMPKGALHEKLKWLKYGIFWMLLVVSFFSIGLAEKLAEVEPFKTTFLVGIFNRAWPYSLFVAAILGLSLFTERPFCKYLCPLGAALAMPTTFRWFGLKRKAECTTCHACAVNCGSLAIDSQGIIDHRECLLCLDCMVLYYDDHACPPLSKERKRREKSGLPLTAINSSGYHIPIYPETVKGEAENTNRPEIGSSYFRGDEIKWSLHEISEHLWTCIQQCLLWTRQWSLHEIFEHSWTRQRLFHEISAHLWPWTQQCLLRAWQWLFHAISEHLWSWMRQWLLYEIVDHLWPWTWQGWRQHKRIASSGLLLAVATTIAWVTAASASLDSVAIISWWLSWSVYEIIIRLQCKPYIKDGLWWEHHYRPAGYMDMISYVMFKNLLIGVTLFIVLHNFGVLQMVD